MTIYEHDFLDPAPDASIISGVGYPGEESPNRIRRVYDSFVSPISHAVFFFQPRRRGILCSVFVMQEVVITRVVGGLVVGADCGIVMASG